MSTSEGVVQQYTSYPYPEPHDDIPAWLEKFHYGPYDPERNVAQFWPEGRPRKKLKILVAGCGTMQAAVLAFQNRQCHVTGIDFSPQSIDHEKKLRERHKLENLELAVLDLAEAPKLERQFDYVLCSGVLHHLPNPTLGLTALRSVLEPKHGAMTLMVYGRLARIGVYALQDAFRRMQVAQDAAGIALVRNVIARLPRHHPARWYVEHAVELRADAAVVDTFLHRQDIAFSVGEILEWINANGLTFQCWVDPAPYERGSEANPAHLADGDRWSIAENVFADMPTHSFVVCRPERDPRRVVDLSGAEWLDCCPVRHPDLRPSEWDADKFVRGSHEMKLSAAEAVLVREANGKQTVRAALRNDRFARSTEQDRIDFAREFYGRMLRSGHVFLSRVPVPG